MLVKLSPNTGLMGVDVGEMLGLVLGRGLVGVGPRAGVGVLLSDTTGAGKFLMM